MPKAGLRARFFPPIPESPQSARPELNGKGKEEREEHNYGIASGSGHGTSTRRAGPILDPEDYQHAKKKLKRAVLEYYRCVLLADAEIATDAHAKGAGGAEQLPSTTFFKAKSLVLTR